VGGVEDIIIHGESGYITPVNDVDRFTDHVLELVRNEPLRKTMGAAGQHQVIRKFSRQRLVRDMKQLYLGFLENQKETKHRTKQAMQPLSDR
jgi:glycosyltransferase involved in cell wall biosynthesis